MTLTPFGSVLVANRGEIALRIMRSTRAAGLRCIAVYTVADAGAPHVAFADAAVCIGEGPVADSYLSIAKILDAARQTGAQAIHPGYGFLSESADFARACADAGLVFIGPSPEAIALMGNKAEAKRRMIAAGVPCVPGYEGADQSDATLAAEANRIGFPVMVKAAAGGGGRGMRLVERAGAFLDALHLAQAEAKASFGSDQIILERAVIRPRHVEVQVFADRFGNVVHLGERDCSVQRRHQKVVEEAPCPVMTPDQRAEMGAAAVEAARAIGYEGAGTVEFLLDANCAFHFLEMNTRLQVEHPVTELVTGRDLVALQLQVAAGQPLGFVQEDVTLTGHAIEVRLYAEDPANGFLPASGDIALWQPGQGPGIRIDAGIVSGQAVSPYYDPMLAKVIAHGPTRDAARRRLIGALQDSVLFGVITNRDFLIDVLGRDSFAAGQATTAFIAEEYGDALGAGQGLDLADIATAAALTYRALQGAAAATAAIPVPREMLGWASIGALTARLRLAEGERVHDLIVRETRGGRLSISDGTHSVGVTGTADSLRIDGQRVDLRGWLHDGAAIHVATGARCFVLTHVQPGSTGPGAVGGGSVTAPMHGNLLTVLVTKGQSVEPGTRLAVLEAMKMQHELLAEVGGTVIAVYATAGSQVKAGDLLIEINMNGT